MESLPDEQSKERAAFVSVLGYQAQLDGFTDDESAFIADIANAFGLSEEEKKIASKLYSEAEILDLLKYITTSLTKLELIRELFFLGYSDGNLSDNEVLFVSKIGEKLGVPIETIEKISDWVIRGIEWEEEGADLFA